MWGGITVHRGRSLLRPLLVAAATALVILIACKDSAAPVVDDNAQNVESLVSQLSFDSYKAAILGLTQFGDRLQGTQRNLDALDWLEAELESYGYTNVVRHPYTFQGQPRESIYATKVGKTRPDEMYMVSAHMDGRGGGEAANDDASGCAVVLEVARVLASSSVELDRSVRFIFWNNEESGLNGSAAYVQSRNTLQGIENPAGSGEYPEPRWLGIIQHDMMMFDHGLPPGANQSPGADIDVEYQVASSMATSSASLGQMLIAANVLHATDYPAELSNNMNNTDSRSFQNYTASVSVRENRRIAEIGQGSNPHWHQATDLYTTFSEADFRLGFNAAQTTLGAVAKAAGAHINP